MELLITHEDTLEIFLRITIAMVLGIVLGTERIMAHKTAGMRTYALVSMGASVFVIMSMVVTDLYGYKSSIDPLRVMAQVIVGIGFIGAGLIIFKGDKISGLTTAAGLWVAAGIGVASGYGLFAIATFIAIATLFIFSILWNIENKIKSSSDKYALKRGGTDDDDY